MLCGMTQLAKQQCIPCRGGVAPLKGAELEDIHAQLEQHWKIIEEHHLEKEYKS